MHIYKYNRFRDKKDFTNKLLIFSQELFMSQSINLLIDFTFVEHESWSLSRSDEM